MDLVRQVGDLTAELVYVVGSGSLLLLDELFAPLLLGVLVFIEDRVELGCLEYALLLGSLLLLFFIFVRR